MGVLPLQFLDGQSYQSLGLDGKEVFSITGIKDINEPSSLLEVEAQKQDGQNIKFKVLSRIDTPLEVKYYKQGGIMNAILYDFLKAN
jgi:aconitate hydratase